MTNFVNWLGRTWRQGGIGTRAAIIVGAVFVSQIVLGVLAALTAANMGAPRLDASTQVDDGAVPLWFLVYGAFLLLFPMFYVNWKRARLKSASNGTAYGCGTMFMGGFVFICVMFGLQHDHQTGSRWLANPASFGLLVLGFMLALRAFYPRERRAAEGVTEPRRANVARAQDIPQAPPTSKYDGPAPRPPSAPRPVADVPPVVEVSERPTTPRSAPRPRPEDKN